MCKSKCGNFGKIAAADFEAAKARLGTWLDKWMGLLAVAENPAETDGQSTAAKGDYSEPSAELSFQNFVSSLTAKAIAIAKSGN